MIELLHYKKVKTFLWTVYLQGYIRFIFPLKSHHNSKIHLRSFVLALPNLSIYVYIYIYQATTISARAGIFFQNKLHISKLLIIMFISMLNMQYWKCNNISLSTFTEEILNQTLHLLCTVIWFAWKNWMNINYEFYIIFFDTLG